MKKILLPLCAVAIMATFAGCVNMRAPNLGYVDNTVRTVKSGSSTSTMLLFFIWGDASVKAAMDQGSVSKIHHIDQEVINILGLFGTQTTIVWGE